jgi:hypothetical protein
MALKYAGGPYRIARSIPASAFSAGHILMYDSASSLSGLDALLAGQIAGVALSDSVESIDNYVAYIEANEDTLYWSDCTIDSQMTPGEELDIEITGGDHLVSTSANTPVFVVAPGGGTEDVQGQSTKSRVRGYLVSNAASTLEFA